MEFRNQPKGTTTMSQETQEIIKRDRKKKILCGCGRKMSVGKSHCDKCEGRKQRKAADSNYKKPKYVNRRQTAPFKNKPEHSKH